MEKSQLEIYSNWKKTDSPYFSVKGRLRYIIYIEVRFYISCWFWLDIGKGLLIWSFFIISHILDHQLPKTNPTYLRQNLFRFLYVFSFLQIPPLKCKFLSIANILIHCW